MYYSNTNYREIIKININTLLFQLLTEISIRTNAVTLKTIKEINKRTKVMLSH